MLTVVAISFTLAAITTIAMMPVMKQQHVNAAYNATLMAFRRARDQAAGDMRVYVVTIAAPGTITITQNTPAGPLLTTTLLPPDVTLHVEPGIPTSPTVQPTTPDGFGAGTVAIDFDQGVGAAGGTTIYFQPDGSALDINGNIDNGVVYMARVGDLYSSRAITLWGATGRLRGWRLYSAVGGPTWQQQ